MKWTDIGATHCSVARALSIVGDRWTTLIIRDAFVGIRRFDDFQKNLGITRHRLADRLERLVEERVFERRAYQSKPVRYEYRLTAKGRDLYPVILMLKDWGDKWLIGPDGPPTVHRHTGCGHVIRPRLVCPECGEPVTPFNMKAEPGPAMSSASDSS